jgi:guanylate kinase
VLNDKLSVSMAINSKKGHLLIITGASGVGKTVDANEFIKLEPDFKKLVTETTRSLRPGEVHGVDYYFRSNDEFQKLYQSGFYAEINEYRPGEFKGTARHHFEKILEGESYVWLTDQVRATNFHTVLNLDQKLMMEIKTRTTTVLIKVSNPEILWQRYSQRELNPNRIVFENRFKKDLEEQQKLESLFENIVLNDGSIEETAEQIRKIISKK